MYSKGSLVLFAAAIVLLAGASVTRAGDDITRERDGGPNEHRTELDEQFARSRSTVTPGNHTGASTPYGYVPPQAKHRHRINR